ncbi:MAG: hypothetical protein CM1200mP27_11730 [Chloroflexota bacterium]|nr:MAG: hypothetical protein CM1200mP27_11730 [Chloroflexota bacterium]
MFCVVRDSNILVPNPFGNGQVFLLREQIKRGHFPFFKEFHLVEIFPIYSTHTRQNRYYYGNNSQGILGVSMRRVAIVSPVRTLWAISVEPSKTFRRKSWPVRNLKETLERSKLDPAKVDDVILGHGYPSGENPAIGRLALLKAGLPIEVPGYQLDRRCSSGFRPS